MPVALFVYYKEAAWIFSFVFTFGRLLYGLSYGCFGPKARIPGVLITLFGSLAAFIMGIVGIVFAVTEENTEAMGGMRGNRGMYGM
mmetsp:Transcript_34223/g.24729  ORF Transcript_34223/g.24729 Transcript_34223/m.24729 type:complete len:86 (-) Transcript_34223:83-340(-)